ncbi:MAG: hypothetical protein GTO35_01235, partial [Gammaproteobacteria bacterium]|nr:hypothetical protein [Gammaproteobacteria bacterium]
KEIANSISAKISETAGQLKTLAQKPETIAKFEHADTDNLDAAAESLQSSFAHAKLLRLLVPGHYEVDSTTNPPLSYASLDMLRQAERSTGPVSAEVHMFGKPEQHIVMVQQVNNKGSELIGLLHLSLSLDYLQQIMSGLTLDNAYIEIRQAASGRELAIAKTGNESFQDRAALVTGINGTRWNLVYWAGSSASISETG